MAADKQSEFAKEIDQYSKLKSGNRLQFLDETGAIFHYDLIKKASKQQNDYNVRSIITGIESSFLIENIVYISYDKNLVNPPSLKGASQCYWIQEALIRLSIREDYPLELLQR